MERKILLISSHAVSNKGLLDHAEDAMSNFLGNLNKGLFIPYARPSFDHDNYFQIVKSRFSRFGVNLESLHNITNISEQIDRFNTIVVGGGNTFRLLKQLQDNNLTKMLSDAVKSGVPYIGWSAGSNLACPTIRTTNDMPIITPSSLDALNLVPFQINPHYFDPDPNSNHRGENRADRIEEYFEEKTNEIPVIGLTEGAWLKVNNHLVELDGISGARVFKKGQPSAIYQPITRFDLSLTPII
jgi:dipeptidase E